MTHGAAAQTHFASRAKHTRSPRMQQAAQAVQTYIVRLAVSPCCGRTGQPVDVQLLGKLHKAADGAEQAFQVCRYVRHHAEKRCGSKRRHSDRGLHACALAPHKRKRAHMHGLCVHTRVCEGMSTCMRAMNMHTG
eukprot:361630-Chlamydomonas_euryale.AAC.4